MHPCACGRFDRHLEAGAKFTAAGIDTIVWAKPAAAGATQAIVFDTETRHLLPADAGRVLSGFVTQCGVRSARLVIRRPIPL